MAVVREAEKEISGAVEQAAKSVFGVSVKVRVAKPREESFGDRAVSTAFELAKKVGKKPQDIAEELASATKEGVYFQKPKAVAGFMNFFFSPRFFSDALEEALKQEKIFGEKFPGVV